MKFSGNMALGNHGEKLIKSILQKSRVIINNNYVFRRWIEKEKIFGHKKGHAYYGNR